jgi:hypothetical protein
MYYYYTYSALLNKTKKYAYEAGVQNMRTGGHDYGGGQRFVIYCRGGRKMAQKSQHLTVQPCYKSSYVSSSVVVCNVSNEVLCTMDALQCIKVSDSHTS